MLLGSQDKHQKVFSGFHNKEAKGNLHGDSFAEMLRKGLVEELAKEGHFTKAGKLH